MTANIKRKSIRIRELVITFLTLCAFIYTFQNRTVEEIIQYSLYISIPFVLIGLFVIQFIRPKKAQVKTGKVAAIIVFLIAFLLTGPAYYSVGVAIKDLFLWLRSPNISGNNAIALIIIITTSIGFLLFYFRLRYRSIYGFTEAIMGIVIAIQKTPIDHRSELLGSDFILAIFTASIYLIVRGLDNIHQGVTKDPTDEIALRIYQYITK